MSNLQNKKLRGVELLLNGNYTIDKSGNLILNSDSTVPSLAATEPYVRTVELKDAGESTLVPKSTVNELCIGSNPVFTQYSKALATAVIEDGTTVYKVLDAEYAYNTIHKLDSDMINVKQLQEDHSTRIKELEKLGPAVTALQNTLKTLFGNNILTSSTEHYGSDLPTSGNTGQIFFLTSNS